MTNLVLTDLRNDYVRLVSWLLDTGRPVADSRGGETLQRTGVRLEFPDPTAVLLPLGVNRKVNARLAAVEALQLLSGTGDTALLLRASPNYTEVLVRPDHAEYGAYGPRLRFQLEQVYRELLNHRASRRAVLTIWREDDLLHDGDKPCTLTLQFVVDDDRLDLVVSMRSQDVWLGVPYDVFMFSQLHLSLARQLGIPAGRYVHNVGSLHVYRSNVEAAGMLVSVPPGEPRPVDYPTGVVSVTTENLFTDVARHLVEGRADAAEVAANAWYARQLAPLLSEPEVTS